LDFFGTDRIEIRFLAATGATALEGRDNNGED